MAFIMSMKDTYRQAVEAATGGKNTVMYDDKGNPSIMVRIPRFNLSDVIDGAPSTPHPAFIVDGVTKNEIWISKYQNVIQDGRAYSLPGQDPAGSINFDDSKAACEAKGEGWHLMTNAEWAAIALWCKKNDTQPRGNNNFGSDVEAPYEHGSQSSTDNGKTGRVATGSGPASWYHDGTPSGIADLNGNVAEWVDGLRLVNGKIYVHQDNNFNTADDLSQFVDTHTYIDGTTGDDTKTIHESGDLVLSDKRDHPIYTGGDIDDNYGYSETEFKSVTAKEGFTVPDLLKYLAIAPIDTDYHGDSLYVRNYGTRFAHRGGDWHSGAHDGVFRLCLSDRRAYSNWSVGFRSALVL